ncbi:pirin family protein [Candidatus Uhrbacteria bacterium]|nr:pirin family protein [Candidatus Uhrbacteria bacterium]
MLRKISATKRFKAEHGWLKSYHLFSFASYQERENMNFGTLRVFNDDFIEGNSGFGAHPHDNMEIITIVYGGTLTHQDSMNNSGNIKAGEVQYMSAGTGVTHAELNQSDKPVHLYQIWIFPNEQNLPPQYDQRDFSNSPVNELVPVASGEHKPGAINIRANSTIFTLKIEPGQTIRHKLASLRGLFVYVKEGRIHINGTQLEKEDQARITDETDVLFQSDTQTELIAIEVPMHLPF